MKLFENLRGPFRKLVLALFDILFFFVVDFGYFLLCAQAHFSIPVDELDIFSYNSLTLLLGIMLFRLALNVYRTVWRYTSTKAYFCMVLADLFGGVAAMGVAYVSGNYRGIWHYLVVASLTALASLMARFTYRLLYKWNQRKRSGERVRRNTAIVGAGTLGTFLAHDLRGNPNSDYNPLFFVDKDKGKIGNTVAGLQVIDNREVAKYVESYEISDIIVAIAGIDSDQATELYHFYRNLGCQVKIYDSVVHEIGTGTSRVIRDFQIEDLLFRKPLNINDQKVLDYYSGKTVLVTGGGGSIGSEICRQIARCKPRKLVIFDIYENNAYDIQQELVQNCADTNLVVEIGSVRDCKRLESVFRVHSPDVVFHAAAHKHVPLMEHSGFEAIKNNVMGTKNTADMAERFGCGKFILISTDKAVNPTNIMGASKRLCEMVVQCRTDCNTSFAAVRFGNVLGSNGSVIPLFKRQIAAGGPVTVTDRRIIRYFMTIQEASQLVLQAGAMAHRGELFVLDMGKPVKIYDLAENMIKLSGLEPGKDIQIQEVGLRPGEKLYEELLLQSENQEKTDNNLIFIERDTPLTRAEVDEKLRLLQDTYESDVSVLKAALAQVVPTYKDSHLVNQTASQSKEMQLVN
jgi:FlaA1/EpsC-like NDP-sugar epimerase